MSVNAGRNLDTYRRWKLDTSESPNRWLNVELLRSPPLLCLHELPAFAFQAVALALHDDHLSVVNRPIDVSGDGHWITEDLRPGGERPIGAGDE